MKKLSFLVILLTILTGLYGCGMQGPLYLPDKNAEKADADIQK